MTENPANHHPKSSLTRKVLSVMGLFGSVELLTMLCGVVRTKLVALWVGVTGIGLLGLYSTAIEFLSTIAQMGLRTAAVRDIAASDTERRPTVVAVVRRYGHILALSGIVLTILASPLLSYVTFGSLDHVVPFVLLSVVVGCNTIVSSRSAILQGEGRLRVIAKASGWSALLSLCASVPIVWFMGIDGIVPLLIAYAGIAAVIYLLLGRRSEPLPHVPAKQGREMARSMIRLGAFLTVSSAVSWLSSYLVISLLNHLGGDRAMGLYQAGYTLSIKYVGVVFTALSLEYFPRLSAAIAAGLNRGQVMLRHETLISVSIITAVGSLMIAFAPLIVDLLYSPDFADVAPMIVAAAPGVVLRAISWAMGFVILARGKGSWFLLTETASGVISVLATVAGYRLGGITGLGVAFTAWYLCYTLIVWAVDRFVLSTTLGRRVWLTCIGSLAATSAVAATAFFCPGWVATTSAVAVVAAALLLLRKLF